MTLRYDMALWHDYGMIDVRLARRLEDVELHPSDLSAADRDGVFGPEPVAGQLAAGRVGIGEVLRAANRVVFGDA